MRVGTEQEALAVAVAECAVGGKGWVILDSASNVIWNIEPDTKVDPDDPAWPVIVHLRGSMSSDSVAVLREV